MSYRHLISSETERLVSSDLCWLAKNKTSMEFGGLVVRRSLICVDKPTGNYWSLHLWYALRYKEFLRRDSTISPGFALYNNPSVCSLRTMATSQSVQEFHPISAAGSTQAEFVSHFCPTHSEEAFDFMNAMRWKGELCDVDILAADQRRIPAHRLVLASCSPYFHAMFTSELLESRQREVSIQGIDSTALELLVEFCYTARIKISEENVQSLLPASSLLQLNSVRDACAEFLKNQLHPSNCLGIRAFADAHICSELLESSHRFALRRFAEVSQTEEFLLLSLSDMLSLVGSDEVNVQHEEDVFNAVMSWVRHDPPNRKQLLGNILPHVRLPLLAREFLMTHVENDEMIRGIPECKDLVIEAMKFHLLPEQRSSLQNSRTRHRKPPGRVPILFSIGGSSLFAIHSECECYDLNIELWCMVTPMTTKRARVGVGVVNNTIYAVGGYDGSSDLSTVEAYLPQNNSWVVLPTMGTRRSSLGVAVLGDLLYAIGGYDGASCLSSVERFDPLSEQWVAVAAMNTKR